MQCKSGQQVNTGFNVHLQTTYGIYNTEVYRWREAELLKWQALHLIAYKQSKSKYEKLNSKTSKFG